MEQKTMELPAFLAMTISGREALEGSLIKLSDEQMIEPGAAGEWSVKDIIAHITWGEREMVEVIQSRALAGSDLWNLTTDERNRIVFDQNKDKPLDEVRAEWEQVFQELVRGLESLSTEELNDPGKFRDMPPDWVPWKVLAGNTYEHYRDHAGDIHNKVSDH